MYKLIVLAATASAVQVSSESTYRPTSEQVPWYKTASSSTWNTPDWKMNYKVPNFGVDHEILVTNNNLANSEKNLKHVLTANFKPKPHPVDYFVPNLGIDKDIKRAQESLKTTEAKLGAWTPTQDKNGFWNVPEAAAGDAYSYNGGRVQIGN